MSHKRRSTLEKKIQADIEADLGSEADLLLLRNAVGKATYVDDEAREFHVPFGLGVGSPDLVASLRIPSTAIGVWFCLEVKAAEGDVDPEQEKCHRVWRRFGALIYVVRSVVEARAALTEARAALVALRCGGRDAA
jgi:hypothetical protein